MATSNPWARSVTASPWLGWRVTSSIEPGAAGRCGDDQGAEQGHRVALSAALLELGLVYFLVTLEFGLGTPAREKRGMDI